MMLDRVRLHFEADDAAARKGISRVILHREAQVVVNEPFTANSDPHRETMACEAARVHQPNEGRRG